MKIQITTEDFRNATKYSDPDNCPLAVAIKRQFPQVTFVSCSIGEVTIGDQQRVKYNNYFVTFKWNSDQEVYGGEYEGMSIDEMINLAKSNPTIEFPTIELKLELK